MEELWIDPVEWVILPGCRGGPFPEEWTSDLLGRSSRVLGLMKGRKIGTVLQHTGWTFMARQQVHYPNFEGLARARVVRTWREDGFRKAKVEILKDEHLLCERECEEVKELIRRQARRLRHESPAERADWLALTRITSPTELAFKTAQRVNAVEQELIELDDACARLISVKKSLEDFMTQSSRERIWLAGKEREAVPLACNWWKLSELTIWTRFIPSARYATGTNLTGRPNPVIGDDSVFVSSCDRVAALDRHSGKMLWHTPIPYVSEPCYGEGSLLVIALDGVLSLDPGTGREFVLEG